MVRKPSNPVSSHRCYECSKDDHPDLCTGDNEKVVDCDPEVVGCSESRGEYHTGCFDARNPYRVECMGANTVHCIPEQPSRVQYSQVQPNTDQ